MKMMWDGNMEDRLVVMLILLGYNIYCGNLKIQVWAGVVLSTGTMNTVTLGEDEIRKNMIIDDVVEIMISLPGKLLTPRYLFVYGYWIKIKKIMLRIEEKILFIDGNSLGSLKTRALRILTDEDIRKIKYTVDCGELEKLIKTKMVLQKCGFRRNF